MSASLPGSRELPASQYDLSTYWGRVKQSAQIADPSTLFVSSTGLEHAKQLISQYKQGQIRSMTPELWQAKKVVDSTLHPDTGEPVFLPFRMSCFVVSNLIVTGGMLYPGMGTAGTVAWQIINQSLNVAINTANSNKSTPLATSTLVQSYALAVSASVSVALGLNALVPRLKRLQPGTRLVLSRLVPFAAVATAGVINVFLMRSEEIRLGIDVYPATAPILADSDSTPSSSSSPLKDPSASSTSSSQDSSISPPSTSPEETTTTAKPASLGRSRRAATLAVGETAVSRVMNATPIMVLPPLALVRLQRTAWLQRNPGLTVPVNLALILATSIGALPLALAIFPQRQRIAASKLEPEFHAKGGYQGEVEFNRGI